MAYFPVPQLLDSLLSAATKQWEEKISPAQIMENMGKIAFHESKNIADAIQISDKTESGEGTGRGLFQFEKTFKNHETGEYEQAGGMTARNRLAKQFKKDYGEDYELPSWLFQEGMKNPEIGFDVSLLSPDEQQMLFLGNIMQMPHKTGEGYIPASFADIDTDEELAQYWAQYHQAGTTPGTDEYETMLDKFTTDVGFFPSQLNK